jgi:elongation factor Ts
MITTDDIKKLRDETGVSVMQCKKALEEAGGDMEKARIILRKQSGAAAAKKAGRSLGAGSVQAYIHAGGAVGAMVLLSSETDFVAKNEEFRQLAYAIAMQVAATNPEYLRREDVPAEAEATARSVFEGEVAGKPADLQEKILSGKLDAYFRDKILLTQPYIKDPERTIEQLTEEAIQKFGERIEISQFVRFAA